MKTLQAKAAATESFSTHCKHLHEQLLLLLLGLTLSFFFYLVAAGRQEAVVVVEEDWTPVLLLEGNRGTETASLHYKVIYLFICSQSYADLKEDWVILYHLNNTSNINFTRKAENVVAYQQLFMNSFSAATIFTSNRLSIRTTDYKPKSLQIAFFFIYYH